MARRTANPVTTIRSEWVKGHGKARLCNFVRDGESRWSVIDPRWSAGTVFTGMNAEKDARAHYELVLSQLKGK